MRSLSGSNSRNVVAIGNEHRRRGMLLRLRTAALRRRCSLRSKQGSMESRPTDLRRAQSSEVQSTKLVWVKSLPRRGEGARRRVVVLKLAGVSTMVSLSGALGQRCPTIAEGRTRLANS